MSSLAEKGQYWVSVLFSKAGQICTKGGWPERLVSLIVLAQRTRGRGAQTWPLGTEGGTPEREIQGREPQIPHVNSFQTVRTLTSAAAHSGEAVCGPVRPG